MPYVKALEATGLSWDAFPAPIPEAESWQPDPDSILFAGRLPDARFNKDPLTAPQKKAFKRDKLLGLFFDGPSENPGVASTRSSVSRNSISTGVGGWPVVAPRATGYPRAPSPPRATEPPENTPPPAFEEAAASKRADNYKCTMETLPPQPLFPRLQTPPMSIASEAFESPTKTTTPVWARKLEHLLGEPSLKDSPLEAAPLARPPCAQAAPPATLASKPPHLRRYRILRTTSTPVTTLKSRFDGVEVAGVPQTEQHLTAPSEVLLSSSISHVRNPSTVASLVPIGLLEETAVQKRPPESCIPQKLTSSSEEHERYLKIKLINIMEQDMDMFTCTTCRDMNRMKDKELDTHFTKTKLMHRLTQEIRQSKDDTGELDMKASLAAFQQEEGKRFKRTDGSSGART
ncbi:hypothetical protein E8E12_005232 [Didymella heteroderae]|uniref:Uncharacterized protein n=1 Tax=Didymella heteroderae TaxID=1769908 RepID=A0A9P5BZ46_9PLEO|nr:hypothetical protein E8E12_005232 [Didymella heteroderae]